MSGEDPGLQTTELLQEEEQGCGCLQSVQLSSRQWGWLISWRQMMRSGRKLWGTKLWLLCPVVSYFLIFCMAKAVLGRKDLFRLQRDGVHHGEEGTATEHKASLWGQAFPRCHTSSRKQGHQLGVMCSDIWALWWVLPIQTTAVVMVKCVSNAWTGCAVTSDCLLNLQILPFPIQWRPVFWEKGVCLSIVGASVKLHLTSLLFTGNGQTPWRLRWPQHQTFL